MCECIYGGNRYHNPFNARGVTFLCANILCANLFAVKAEDFFHTHKASKDPFLSHSLHLGDFFNQLSIKNIRSTVARWKNFNLKKYEIYLF